jgi:hypothetical protein
MEVQIIPVSELRTPERNVRIHPEPQLAELARALTMFGQTRPIVVDEKNTILIGNGLHSAMQRVGMTQASVYRMEGLSSAQKHRLMLSDNKIYQLGLDDYDSIMALVKNISEQSNQLDVPGFDDDVLRTLLAGDAAATQAALDAFGVLSPEEITARQRDGAVEGEIIVCPHCGQSFTYRHDRRKRGDSVA